jgi:outer membrane protein assembly factor BamD
MKNLFTCLSLLCLLSLSACAGTAEPYNETRDWTVEQLYEESRSQMLANNYTSAIKYQEIIQSRFPYGKYAQQALMDQAFTYYKDNEPEQALATIDRFIKLYPAHDSLDYVFYLRGLVYFHADDSPVLKWVKQDLSERDPKGSSNAFNAFNDVVKRFPNSQYVADSNAKMAEISMAQGNYQMHVARYYMKREAWLAAANRAQTVIKEYANTNNNEEALAIIVAAYDRLEQASLSADAQKILDLNYPNSPYSSKKWNKKSLAWWRLW